MDLKACLNKMLKINTGNSVKKTKNIGDKFSFMPFGLISKKTYPDKINPISIFINFFPANILEKNKCEGKPIKENLIDFIKKGGNYAQGKN